MLAQRTCSLTEAARAGDGPTLIRSLFDETLVQLRKEQEHPENEDPTSVAGALEAQCRHESISDDRVIAARAIGPVLQPSSLWRKLLGPGPPWRKCALHGDLHGDNVLVRKTDAIVIDFAHARTGPMCADPASLEVWLAFRHAKSDPRDERDWRAVVDRLYAPETLERLFTGEPCNTSGWLSDCVREIREFARISAQSADEYCRVLAVYLLRWSSFPAEGEAPEDRQRDAERRAYAYWLANRLIVYIDGSRCHG